MPSSEQMMLYVDKSLRSQCVTQCVSWRGRNYSKQSLKHTSNNHRHIHFWRRLNSLCLLPANQLMQGIRNPRDPSSLQLSWFQSVRKRWHHIALQNSPWWGRFISPLLESAELSCFSFSTAVKELGLSWVGGETLWQRKRKGERESEELVPLKDATSAFVAFSNRHAWKKAQLCSALHCTFKPLHIPSGSGVRCVYTHTHTHTCANNWH